MPQPAPIAEMNVPFPNSPFFDVQLAAAAPTPEAAARLAHFREHGYLVVDLGIDDFDELAARVIAELAPHYQAVDRRVAEAWYFSDGVRRIASHPPLLALLRQIYRRRPIPFQTLNFDAGTEQAAHSDTLHFHCVPQQFMCGAWVALEDIDEANGPLFIYPGSHHLPVYEMHDLGLPSRADAYHDYERRIAAILAARGYPRVELHLRKGQVAIWAANLFHGGVPILDRTRTRHSQVTHYYFEDGFYYLPLASDLPAGRICYREVIDIGTGQFVRHRYRDHDIRLTRCRNVLRYPRPLPAFVRRERDPLGLPIRLRHAISKTLETWTRRPSTRA